MADRPLNFPDGIIPVWTVSGVVMGRVWTEWCVQVWMCVSRCILICCPIRMQCSCSPAKCMYSVCIHNQDQAIPFETPTSVTFRVSVCVCEEGRRF